MADRIPSVWDDDISIDEAGPRAILIVQANDLARRTQGILRADIQTSKRGEIVRHDFLLVAQLLNDYSHHLFSVEHAEMMVYPASLLIEFVLSAPKENWTTLRQASPMDKAIGEMAGDLAKRIAPFYGQNGPSGMEAKAYSDADFTNRVREILTSSTVRAVVNSLIARSNEKRSPTTAEPAAV